MEILDLRSSFLILGKLLKLFKPCFAHLCNVIIPHRLVHFKWDEIYKAQLSCKHYHYWVVDYEWEHMISSHLLFMSWRLLSLYFLHVLLNYSFIHFFKIYWLLLGNQQYFRSSFLNSSTINILWHICLCCRGLYCALTVCVETSWTLTH